jgi:4-hydroxymandelate oxidase
LRPHHQEAANPAQAIARVVEILRREFEFAMALTGRPTVASIDRSVIW